MSTVRSKMEDAAQTLREAGLNVVVIAGKDLANIPAPARVKSFSFTDTYLVASLEDLEVGLPYDAPIVAVFCKAPEGSPAELTQPTGSAVLDIYGSRKGELLRMSFVQEVVNFSDLGDLKLPTVEGNMLKFVAECERRFTKVQFDRRLENVRVRRSLIIDTAARPPHEERKGFSYATTALAKLLESISPDLKDISQFDTGVQARVPHEAVTVSSYNDCVNSADLPFDWKTYGIWASLRRTKNREPQPSSLSAHRSPPKCSTIVWLMARPRPAPPCVRVADRSSWLNFSKIVSS